LQIRVESLTVFDKEVIGTTCSKAREAAAGKPLEMDVAAQKGRGKDPDVL